MIDRSPVTTILHDPFAGGARLHCRVLLAEDSADNQRLLSLILRKAGADVVVVENGLIAMDLALEASPAFDVILMDVQMPVLDGLQATLRLRDAGYNAPIIALTALSENRDACLAAGCNDFAVKPIDYYALIELVAKWAKAKK